MSKIAIVSHSYPTRKSPTQASFIKREAHLIAQSQTVEIHLPSVYAFPFQRQYFRSRNPEEEIIPVHRFSYLSFPGRRFASITQKSISSNLLQSLESQKPDLVHLHWLFPSGLAATEIKHAGYPVLLTIHGGDWYYNLSHAKLMQRLIDSLNHCDKILCVGKQLLNDIAHYQPELKNKLYHLPHGVNTELFCPEKNPGTAKEKLNWEKNKTHLLAVGNLFRVKGYDILLRAFAEIVPQENYRLHIVAPRSDDDAKMKTENLMDSLDLRDRITFYGQKSQEELADFYRAADLFVSSSRKEGFGLVVAEALACGTPVVATRSGGPEEIVSKETGWLVAPEKPAELKIALEKMIADKDSYNPVALHRYIAENFSLSSKKDKLNAIYQEVSVQRLKI